MEIAPEDENDPPDMCMIGAFDEGELGLALECGLKMILLMQG